MARTPDDITAARNVPHPVYMTSGQDVPHPDRFPDNGVPAEYLSLAAGRIVSDDYPGEGLTEEEANNLRNCSEL